LNNSGICFFIFDKIKYSSKFTIFLHKIFLLGKEEEEEEEEGKKNLKINSTFLKII
jgi:hypothetical protein